jgi:hypothetical protein
VQRAGFSAPGGEAGLALQREAGAAIVDAARRVARLLEQCGATPALRRFAVHVLCDYYSQAAERGVPADVRAALLPGTQALLAIMRKHDLQQMHVALRGPAREILRVAYDDWTAHTKFSGKI